MASLAAPDYQATFGLSNLTDAAWDHYLWGRGLFMYPNSAFCASSRARLWPWLLLLAVSLLTVPVNGGAQSTTIPEIQVSTDDIVDFEFDWGRDGVYCPTCNSGDGNARLIFSDRDHNMWLGYVDPETGAFNPANGRALLIDTGAAFATEFGNGPEWMFSTRGSEIVYTKYFPGRQMNTFSACVAIASRGGDGTWQAGIVEGGLKKQSPIATLDVANPDPRINYQNFAKTEVYWRVADDPSSETLMPIFDQIGSGSRRWVPGTHKIIFSGPAAPDSSGQVYQQVFLYDTDTDQLEQLTFDAATKWGAIMWRAPEFDNHYVFVTISNRSDITIWRLLPDQPGANRWVNIKTVPMPESMPFAWSPEPFVYNGQSYVIFQVSSNFQVTDMSIPTQLAMTGIIPSISSFRMLTNDSSIRRVRMDPEYYITADGPFVYYNRYVPSTSTRPVINDGVWRVDTKLGPPIAATEPLVATANRGVPVLTASSEPGYPREGVVLRWTTDTGVGLQGFNVYRSSEENGTFELINEQPIPSHDNDEYVDSSASAGKTYWYRLGAAADDGERMSETISIAVPAPEMTLHQNHPNPFKSATTVSFVLREKAPVTLAVYDVEGRLVRLLADEAAGEGYTERIWDGRDANNNQVSSGVYFYRLTAGNRMLTKKMVLIR